ncbi:TRAP transporter large permease [Agathobaculum sp.]|uniref:TRAP transporter large permease n=1 Tax=Agathobaculum sp. TaxID=2048138 RepID=UPI002A7EDF9C|nr:TRAP transporter large permease [Agathobaculum sp.]MDY3618219.1 TRAP transporter large permease [Agathobaculum sp.]
MSTGLFFAIFAVFLAAGIPVIGAFGGLAILPNLMNGAFPYSLDAAVRSMVGALDSFPLLAVPLFMLSGIIMALGGVSEKLFNFFAYFIGNKTAGFPCAVIVTCLFYGAISGSGPATTAAVGAMAIPFLTAMGYDALFATSLVAVSGGLGIIIPPSIPFIVFSSTAGVSTSTLFIAGVIPGLLIGACLMVYTYFYCRKHGEDKEKLRTNYAAIRSKGFLPLLKESIWALLTPVIILGSIYGGIASPTEAAVISVFYALIISLFVYNTITLKDIPNLLMETVKTYGPILFVIASAVAFSRVLTMLRIPQEISEGLLSVLSNKIVILLVVNLILLVAGMIMDALPNIMILTPILLPVMQAIGINPIHFGVFMIVNLAIGFVTPPMGINLYVASSMTKIPVTQIARMALPFIGAFLAALAMITFIPQISLFLTQL